ncbi:MAG: UDP-N-acetylmuramoyl-L-alanine--D-glutamate ligase, partial [Deltaproteobacteria bacterium]
MPELRGKRVLVVGLARSGKEAARVMAQRGATVTVTDSRPPSAFAAEIRDLTKQKVGMELGQHREATFLKQDLIIVSPGVPWDMPLLARARERGVNVVPEIEAASWFLEGPIVGITGSNGKTTTTSLLGKMVKASGLSVFVGGNIGVPLISAVDRTSPETILVTELSSFQLEAIKAFRPHVAVLLNLTPNHLDRHPSFEAYAAAKARIFLNQTEKDWAVLNADDPAVLKLAEGIKSRKVFFSRRRSLPDGVFVSNGHIRYRAANLERMLLETSDVFLRGGFNVENVLAAATAACMVGADFDALRSAVRDFPGVEHRLEYVRKIREVEFYNDSKATSVDATAKALTAFERGVHLILGGKDKGAPYTPLRPLIQGRVREILLIGAASDRIERELRDVAVIVRAGDLETAVHQAFRNAVAGETVLLAPACASFDQFEDYEHRGRVFKKIVSELARAVDAGGIATSAPPAAAPEPEPEIVPDVMELKEAEITETAPETATRRPGEPEAAEPAPAAPKEASAQPEALSPEASEVVETTLGRAAPKLAEPHQSKPETTARELTYIFEV